MVERFLHIAHQRLEIAIDIQRIPSKHRPHLHQSKPNWKFTSFTCRFRYCPIFQPVNQMEQTITSELCNQFSIVSVQLISRSDESATFRHLIRKKNRFACCLEAIGATLRERRVVKLRNRAAKDMFGRISRRQWDNWWTFRFDETSDGRKNVTIAFFHG